MEENSKKVSTTFKIFGKNLLFEIVLSVILMLILSLLLSKTNIDEKIIKPSIIGISAFSIILGSILISHKTKMKGITLRIN